MVEEIVIEADQNVKEQDQGLDGSSLKISKKLEVGKSKRKHQDLWDVRTHWELVQQAQAIVDEGVNLEDLKIDNDWEDAKNMEIQEDNMNMLVLNGSQLFVDYEETKKARIGKKILQYYQKNDNLMFKIWLCLGPMNVGS